MAGDGRLDLTILGASGSIGLQALDLVRTRSDRFRVVGLAIRSSVDCLRAWVPKLPDLQAIAVADPAAASEASDSVGADGPSILCGPDAATRLVRDGRPHAVLNAIVGAAGLEPSLAALDAGADLLLANKESLVVAGQLVTERSAATGTPIIPVDSEHGSIFRCLPTGQERERIRSIVLTASGGPFRERSIAEVDAMPPAAALKHPTWSMGPRITVDSATLMNKGFEVIEAYWLFGIDPDAIEVVVHPQSVIHGMVRLSDGSVLAHMSPPDMRTPIAFALDAAWRNRFPESGPAPSEELTHLDFVSQSSLTFEAPDVDRFPCLQLAYVALRAGGTAPTVLNAADEVAVAAYLDGTISFSGIASVIDHTLNSHRVTPASSLDVILEADRWARDEAARRIHAQPTASGRGSAST